MVRWSCRLRTRQEIGCAAGRLGEHVDGGHVVHGGRHLGGHETPPDEVVQLKLAFGQVRLKRFRKAPHIRRPDRLVRLLSVRDFRLVLRRLIRQVTRAKGLFDDPQRQSQSIEFLSRIIDEIEDRRRTGGPVSAELLDLLQAEVNVKEVVVVQSDAELVRLQGRPNFRSLGARYGRRTPLAARAVERLEAAPLRRLEEGHSVEVTFEGESFTLLPDDVTVSREVVTDWLVQSDGPFVAALDPAVSDELRLEGLARELVNRVQQLRKDAGYEYVTRIEISVVGDPMLERAAREFEQYIAGETLARRVLVGEALAAPDREQQVDIDGYAAVIAVRRADGRA